MTPAIAFLDGKFTADLPMYVTDAALSLSANASQVLAKRYLRRGPDGELETPAGLFYRVARFVGRADLEHGCTTRITDKTIERFYQLLSTARFLPNTPTFTGAGTPLGQLSACFVLPLADDMGKEPEGIFNTMRDAALIQQTGGGNGFSFGRLRRKGARVATSQGAASGPVSFLEVFDKAFGAVAQGGSRRGANMAVLPVNHPDIIEFITCKAEEGRIANFNISVAVTDAFMYAVRADAQFELINPEDGTVARTVQAREIYDLIVKYAHKNGEPGMLFIDAANASNPVPHIATYEATNPCGEQFLLPYENCCLGSINLAKHVAVDTFGRLVVDWVDLAATISDAVHFLDNVVTANAYVPAVPKLREAGLRARRIGLGIMGLGDLFYLLGVRYGSEEGQELAGQIMEFVRYHAMARSVTLAVARGPFPAYRGSVYQQDTWRTPEPLVPFSRPFRRPHLDWDLLREQIRTHGIRNAAQTTIAPTGTLSTVADCEGYGCEPVFALGYIRHFKDGDQDVTLPYTSPLFDLALAGTHLSAERRAVVREHVALHGTCQTISELPLALRHTFVVSADISAEEHVRMQAALQAFVDNSLSKTCNFPAGATVADVDRAYQMAWELGCKGLTVYVTGSRNQVVLETKATQAAKATPDEGPISLTNGHAELTISPQGVILDGQNRVTAALRMAGHLVERQRPDRLTGTTYKKQTPLGAAYVTVNVDTEGEPFEVFLNVGKAGSETSAVSEAIGRLISYILRMPSPLAPGARLGEVAQSLLGIGGDRGMGFGAKRVKSLADAIGQVLGGHLIGDHTHDEDEAAPSPAASSPIIESAPRLIGELCPECGEAALLNIEGCRKCYACNYTEC